MNLPFFAVKAYVPGGVQNQAEKNSENAFRPVPVQKFTFPEYYRRDTHTARYLPGRDYIRPPPLPPFLRGRGFVYFEAPRGRNFIRPPILYAPHPLEGYFQGWGGWGCIIFGPAYLLSGRIAPPERCYPPPPLVLSLAQTCLCDTPFCNMSRDRRSIPYRMHKRTLRYYPATRMVKNIVAGPLSK